MRRLRSITVTLALIVGPAAVLSGSLVPLGSSTTSTPVTAVFIGDSYTAGAGATGGDTRFTALIARANGWTEVNLGRGGTGFLPPANPDPAMARIACGLDYCHSYTEMIPEAAAASPDIVIVSGGRNDLTIVGPEWAAGVDAFYAALRAAVPDARIIATSPIWDTRPTPMMVLAMCAVVQRAVTSVGGVYVDLHDPLQGRSDRVSGDGVHPNDAGHAAIAEAFAAAYTRTDAATFPQPAARR